MKRLIFALIGAAAISLLAPASGTYAAPKGGNGAEPAPRRPAPETLSAESLFGRPMPCRGSPYPNPYARAGAPTDRLSPDEVTALALGALAVLAIAFVLVSSRTRKLQGRRRRQRRRAAAAASGL